LKPETKHSIARVPVTSSQIVSIGYDEAARKLHIEFKGYGGKPGPVYEYDGIDPATHEKLIGKGVEGHSVGKTFGLLIKPLPKERYSKIAPVAEGKVQA
jgi:KTSC domain